MNFEPPDPRPRRFATSAFRRPAPEREVQAYLNLYQQARRDGWLSVDQVGEMQPDTRLYPEYDAFLERSMREETQRFFREVLVNNLGVDNFIDSDFASSTTAWRNTTAFPASKAARYVVSNCRPTVIAAGC